MKISIVSDQKGNIVSITQPGDVGDKVSGIMKAGVVAAAGHTVHEIDLPQELAKLDLLEIHKGYKVDPKKGTLVKG
ncbi:MAG TPA: hypothetical protein VMH28_27745 [Candidatus Acidoferrales bacterium]|nr:hypothetical protein [Candidatus Acidoferrales bacterium]